MDPKYSFIKEVLCILFSSIPKQINQQCGMCDQQRLRPACAYTQSDQSSMYRVVWVYTCQNATLLEITCHGSFVDFLKIWLFDYCLFCSDL